MILELPTFKPASVRYHAVKWSGDRKGSDIHYVVVHSTEGDTAESAAVWFTNQNAQGSANMVCGDYDAYRTLDDFQIPWAAPPLNTNGYHIEIAGFAEWSNAKWTIHSRRIKNAAYRAAIRCLAYKIPIVFIDAAGLERGEKGITSHREVSAAFHLSTHTDPGPKFPYDSFVAWTKKYAETLS